MGSGIIWIPPLTKGVALGSKPSLAVLGFLLLKTQILVGPTSLPRPAVVRTVWPCRPRPRTVAGQMPASVNVSSDE